MDYLYNKITFYLFVMMYSAIASVYSCHATSNLALNKPYTISPAATYPRSAPLNDITSLTDGKYTVGYFWAQKTTVGWQFQKTVEILIDLGKETDVGKIVFSSARGIDAGVNFPSNIFVFVGLAKDTLLYIDDMANDPDNVSGPYKVKQFVSKDIGGRGRYVLLEIIPKGPYLFCDEIEVLQGRKNEIKFGNLTIERARDLADKKRRLSIERELLYNLTKSIRQIIPAQPEEISLLAPLKQRIGNISSTENSESIKIDLLMLRGEMLRARLPGKQILVEAVNPWDSISPVFLSSGVVPKNLSLSLPQGGYDHAALLVTNLLPESRQISISLSKIPEESLDLSIYQVPFIKSAALEYVADPLVLATDGFTLRQGESRMVFVTAHGKKPGAWQALMKIVSGSLVTSIPINCKVLQVRFPRNFSLNSVVWDELNLNLTSNRKAAAVTDLSSHHSNVIVVPVDYLPIPLRKEDPYCTSLERYLKLYKDKSGMKILLFAHLGSVSRSTVNGKYQFMGVEWKSWFREWFDKIVKACVRVGVSKDQIYLYPFDEVEGKQLDMLASLSSWAHMEIPSLRLYTTINAVQALKAVQYVDIAQVVPQLLNNLRFPIPKVWLYDAKGPSKSNSPYSYYRMMSWKAFYFGLSGVGFWAYGDAGSGKNAGTAWDDFDGRRPDYTVIYEGDENSIISSRRWEAWRMGIEDYELLLMYAKTKGNKAAKVLAKMVLDHPDDTSRADVVRHYILNALSGQEKN